MTISAAIFAGGASTRFGSPKATAVIDGKSFLARIVSSLRIAGIESIAIIGGPLQNALDLDLKHLDDEDLGQGPFGALITAMRSCSSELLLTLPCDVPWIDDLSCQKLAALNPQFDVRIARTTSPQWLCSTWSVGCLERLELSYAKGERAIYKAINDFKIEFLDLPEHLLRNVNTPKDLEQ